MVELYSDDPRIQNLTRDALAGQAEHAVVTGVKARDLPTPVDFVVTAAALSSGLERFAATLGALTVVLPEGGEWLAGKCRQAQDEYLPLVLVGSDYRRIKL